MDNTKNLTVPIKIILDLGVPILIEPSRHFSLFQTRGSLRCHHTINASFA